MSNRRERVTRAIEEADRRYWQNRIQGGDTYFTELADAALSVIDAEPTEACISLSEIERMMNECLAAANKEANERYRSDPYPLTGMLEGAAVRDKKRVLDDLRSEIKQYIAARKAGKE